MACLEVLIVFLLVGSLAFNHADAVDGEKRSMISRKEYSEFKKQLEFQKRSAVKSIKTEDGDIFDCIDINKQPAFNHPMLKNHTIQMMPSYRPKMVGNRITSDKDLALEIGLKGGGCPQGFVPIRRARIQDLLISRSLTNSGKRYAPNFKRLGTDSFSGIHTFATMVTLDEKYYGIGVDMNVWNPKVAREDQATIAQLRVLNGYAENLNSVDAGWIVYPKLYGDNNTRLFVLWTVDGYEQTGCHDLLCPGFVQFHKELPVGKTLTKPLSTYDGSQDEIFLAIIRDEEEPRNWWLYWGRERATPVGYWPNSLFTTLANKPAAMQWGGHVFYNEKDFTLKPQMGSGHPADEGPKKACFIRQIWYTDENNAAGDFNGEAHILVDDENCYQLRDDGDRGDGNGRVYYFGGPGGNC